MTTNPFCQTPPKRIALANDLAFVIRDGYPIADGHPLVITRRHIGSFFAIIEAERAAMLELLDQARAGLDAAHAPPATTSASTTARRPGRPCRTRICT